MGFKRLKTRIAKIEGRCSLILEADFTVLRRTEGPSSPATTNRRTCPVLELSLQSACPTALASLGMPLWRDRHLSRRHSRTR